ncbi:MAG: SUMF1/EgtB/PvdO family nonheme iron enzyme [Planctomycetes bacterium]|nr:SUMF1/EgtB/PvdO family nonheme iron enzyme [Planctomycetota bacterium]
MTSSNSTGNRLRRLDQGAAQHLRGDLDLITMMALRKEPQRRYGSPAELAADLQRYVEHEPVTAHAPSWRYRARKFFRRYRVESIAGILVLLAIVAGGTTASIGFRRASARAAELSEANDSLARKTTEAEANAQQARDNAARAEANAERAEDNAVRAEASARDATERKAEFDQLAGVVVHERAVAGIEELYPAWPDKIPAIEAWLEGDVKRLRELRPEIEKTLRKLRDRALPWTEEQQRADREGHGSYAEWQRLRDEVASLERAAAVRAGGELPPVELPEALRDADARTLNAFAWPRVAPQAEEREVFGEEFRALAAAERAVARAREAGDPELYQFLDTLAWALVATGQDARAQAVSQEAYDAAPTASKQDYEGYRLALAKELGRSEQVLRDRREQLQALDREVATRQTWAFADEQDGFLFRTLGELVEKLDALESTQVAEVREKLLRWADYLRSLQTDHDWLLAWARAAESIAANERYAAAPIARLRPQTGLWPIGENPETHLYEFYHLRSAWDGMSVPDTLAIPERDAEGRIPVGGETGIVFVLVPGGRFLMGAQNDHSAAPNFDSQASLDERPFEVRLDAFFLAAHEVTQGQWYRLTGQNPSYHRAGQRLSSLGRHLECQLTETNPVEQVSWAQCYDLFARHRLCLPTEAQWEFGCRGGTTTPWNCARDKLQFHANLADSSARPPLTSWECEPWNDSFIVHAPVGSFRPNAFGLYDVHGNVREWVLDAYVMDPPRQGDGLRGDPWSFVRVVFRGGGYADPARDARSSVRDAEPKTYHHLLTGVRAARMVTDDP